MKNTWFERRNECPVCLSEKFTIIYENKFDESPIRDYLIDFYSPQGGVEFDYLETVIYALCDCKICGAIFQRDIPNDFLMKKLYTKWIDPKMALKAQEEQANLENYVKYSQEISQIIAFFEKKPSELKIFDFGMGWAKWAIMVKAFGCDSYGTDLAEDQIAHARSNGVNTIQWDEIPEHNFDFINTEQVFEHISKPLETLLHLKKGLKKTGILKLSVPGATNIGTRLKLMDWKLPKNSKDSLNPVAPLEHINFYRRSSLLMMAKKAGMVEVFIPVKLQYRYVTDWGGTKKSLRNLVLPIFRNVFQRQNYVFLKCAN